MKQLEIKKHWESAAPGWAKWEEAVANWMEPATEAMLSMAGVVPGAKVLDLACGAGSQTLDAASRVGEQGHVVASDISDTMLEHVFKNAKAAGLDNISTLTGPAGDLEIPAESFDAVICRLALMLFPQPARALTTARRGLKPGGKMAVVVFTLPDTNAFMARPMQILLRHAGKPAPEPGQPGIFALGGPGVLEKIFAEGGFTDFEQCTLNTPLRMPSANHALEFLQEAAGAYRAVVSDCSEAVRTAAWREVASTLEGFETVTGFEGPAEVLVGAGVKRV